VDPHIVVRRMIAHSSEDVGLADPMAMLQALGALQSLDAVGMPEAGLSIAQAIIYICESPKSNAVVVAKGAAIEDAERSEFQPVPVHLRDTSYKGYEKIGSGVGYKYAHDYEGHYVEQEYMPVESKGKRFYRPSDQGYEIEIQKIRKQRNKE
jgi:putative ATPase